MDLDPDALGTSVNYTISTILTGGSGAAQAEEENLLGLINAFRARMARQP